MKALLTIAILFFTSISIAQTSKTKVLSLGTFHFAFHNRDVKKTAKKDQIDVFDKEFQLEIENIVKRISAFKPTIIAIEIDPSQQEKMDSLYSSYLNDKHILSREEYEQIGFRVAKKVGLKKLYCVNDWGKNYKNIDSILENDTLVFKKFKSFFYDNPDSAKMYYEKDVFKSDGITEQLMILNDSINLEKSLGNYFMGVFKYELPAHPFFGVDFTTGWWFNRNLRIFRNIQKIETTPNDKILVIYGAGHMNLLNIFFHASPEYELVNTNEFLID